MPWYYASEGQQRGPVSDDEFNGLVRGGVVRAETLVWREGWPDWRAWGTVAAAESAAPVGDGAGATSAQGGPAAKSEGAAGGGEPLPLVFTGDGSEYFRVWIVNVLLTIATFGIYAAWAKVRTRRYFHANTSLAGHAFEYLAEPKKILIGNLIMMGAFFLFNLTAAISPAIQFIIMGFVALAVPWVITRAVLFNARNVAWRGIRFGFSGTYGEALVNYILMPLLVPLTLGLIWPYLLKRRREWLATRHRYGTSAFSFSCTSGQFYGVYLKSLLFFLPLIAAYGALFAGMAVTGALGGSPSSPVAAAGASIAGFGLMFVGFASAFTGTQFVRARIFSLAWSGTSVGPHRFVASMRTRDLVGQELLNMLLLVVTLGFAWPWVAVRRARFQLAHLHVLPGGSLDEFAAESRPEPGALSEAAGDFLDVDVGFGL